MLVALIGSRRFSPSIYESIIEARRLPYLPTLKQFALDGNVSDVHVFLTFRIRISRDTGVGFQ